MSMQRPLWRLRQTRVTVSSRICKRPECPPAGEQTRSVVCVRLCGGMMRRWERNEVRVSNTGDSGQPGFRGRVLVSGSAVEAPGGDLEGAPTLAPPREVLVPGLPLPELPGAP